MGDKTLTPRKRQSKKRMSRSYKAYLTMMSGSHECRFCSHLNTEHLTSSGQPFFYRVIGKEDAVPNTGVYTHYFDEAKRRAVLIHRVVVAKEPELITMYCKQCALDKNTSQVMCYQRTLANGEIKGLDTYLAQQEFQKFADSKSDSILV